MNKSINIGPLFADKDVPVLTPQSKDQGALQIVTEFLGNNREEIENNLYRAGVVLIRGFAVDTPEKFRDVSASICPDLRNYRGGDSPRNGVCDKVYTSSEYGAELEVLLHNELSYAGWSPDRVFFGCMFPSTTGGETPVADGRAIYQSIDPQIRAIFEQKGVTYLQHLRDADGAPGIGKSWQETFETESKEVAEEYLRESNMEFEWTSLGIRTAAKKPAVKTHPVTGEKCWHNQADQWHRGMLSVKDTVGDEAFSADGGEKDSTCGQETLGNHVVFGDDSEIQIHDLKTIRQTAQQHEVKFPWQPGDVLVIDNILSMHGRKPYSGDRSLLVAMA